MKTFKQLIAEVAEPNNEDELNFKAKHAIELITFPPADETAYSGGTKRSKRRRADYDEGEDEDVYEAKKLDPVGKADADIDNDGDTDKSDDYLHARRKAIARAMKEAIEKKLDPVGKADADIDNDGDTDKSDEFLHARRKAIAKAMKKEAATSPYAIGMASAMKQTGDKPPLKKSTITKAHKIAKSIEKNESLEEANSSKIIAGVNAGDSIDVIVQNNLNKKGDNKDEILKVIRDYNWKKRMKKEEVDQIDEATPTKKEITRALQSVKAQPKEKVTLKKSPWDEKNEDVGLAEAALTPQQRERLDHLIDMAATTSHPEYDGDENTSKYINLIKKEFGDTVAKQVDDGLEKMHWGRDNQSSGNDKLAARARRRAPRVTSSGKMNKQDVSALKNRIMSDKKLWGGIAKKANLPEEVSLDEAVAGPQDCWPGYRKVGTKMGTGRNAGKRVNDCQKISEATKEPEKAKKDFWKFAGMTNREILASKEKANKADKKSAMKKEEVELDEGIKEKISGAIRREKQKEYPLLQNRRDVAATKAGSAYAAGDQKKGDRYMKWRDDNMKKEEVNLDESFKAGIVKLNDGSSVIIKEADAKLLNQLVSELADKNREAMMKTAMKDKKGFNEILGFAKEAL